MVITNKESSAGLLLTIGLTVVFIAVLVFLQTMRLISFSLTTQQSGVVGNAAPSVDAVVPSDASGTGSVALPAPGFTLNEGAPRALYVRGTVSDPNGCADVNGVNLTVYRPGVAFGGADGMNASGVLGQADFTSGLVNRGGSIAANTLKTTYRSAIDPVGRRLFVADYGNNRVLEYDLNADGTPVDGLADHVLGQANLISGLANRGGSTANNTLSGPVDVAFDSTTARLLVSDQNNNRVLSFDLAATLTNGMAASHVLGQAIFSGNSANRGGSPAANTLNAASQLTVDAAGQRLFVADNANNRVLEYDLAAGVTDGMAASHVLGQSNFLLNSANRGSSVAANGMQRPQGLAWDAAGSRLFVADVNNHRVLAFNLAAGLTDGMAAAHVLGQADFSGGLFDRGGSTGANTLDWPLSLAWDATASRLFVVDYFNYRVLAFDLAGGLADGMAAAHVLGQANFTSNLANRGGLVAANTLKYADGVTWDNVHNRLFVSDQGNNRVLWFSLDADAACAPDANNCFVASIAKAALAGCTGAGDADATFEAAIPVANFADPTDAGSPYATGSWRASAVVTDAAGVPATLAADFEVQSLAAFAVAPSLMDYGTIALGATSAQQVLTFTNTGNRGVNSYVHADGPMRSSLAGFADVPSAQTHYSTAPAAAWAAGTPVGTSDSDLPLALPQQDADAGPAPTVPAYFYLKLPATGIRGTYTNTLFFTAYAR